MRDFLLRMVCFVVGSSLAVILVRIFNVFSFVVLVPKEEKYELCMSVYMTGMDMIASYVSEYILRQLDRAKIHVKVIFYQKDHEPNIDIPTEIVTKEDRLDDIMVRIVIIGVIKKKLDNCRVVINSNDYVDFQWGHQNSSFDAEGSNAIIKIEKICGNQTEPELYIDMPLVLMKREEGIIRFCMDVHLKGKRRGKVVLNSNKTYIKMGGQ